MYEVFCGLAVKKQTIPLFTDSMNQNSPAGHFLYPE